jgi:hypothetical protein
MLGTILIIILILLLVGALPTWGLFKRLGLLSRRDARHHFDRRYYSGPDGTDIEFFAQVGRAHKEAPTPARPRLPLRSTAEPCEWGRLFMCRPSTTNASDLKKFRGNCEDAFGTRRAGLLVRTDLAVPDVYRAARVLALAIFPRLGRWPGSSLAPRRDDKSTLRGALVWSGQNRVPWATLVRFLGIRSLAIRHGGKNVSTRGSIASHGAGSIT